MNKEIRTKWLDARIPILRKWAHDNLHKVPDSRLHRVGFQEYILTPTTLFTLCLTTDWP